MTFGIPGRPPSGAVREARTAPLARVSRSALELNLRAVLSSSPAGVVDVRADGWGHGAAFVARTALQEGARMLLVDDAGAAELADTVDPARLIPAGDPSTPEAVYGLTPGFAPVLSLIGAVLSLKLLRAGEGVSYGYTHRAESDTTVALVTGGYAQGVVRALGNSVSVGTAHGRHPIIGRVAMDVCVIDVGEESGVQPGDEVVFFGDPGAGEPGIAAWVAATGLEAAELVAAVGLRNDREYVR